MARTLAEGFVRLTVLALLVALGIFYLRLGWFLWIIWPAMIVPAYFLTRRHLAVVERAWRRTVILLLLYVVSNYLVWFALFDHQHLEEFEMTWRLEGRSNDHHQTEVILTFAEFPGHFIGLYSDDVADHLSKRGSPTVPVTFEVTSDLGCMRGFREVEIGDLREWKSAWGYAGTSESVVPSPWKEPFWCP